MTFGLSLFKDLPADTAFNYFLFFLGGGGLRDLPSEWIDRNFHQIGKNLGVDAVFIRGYTEGFDSDVIRSFGEEIKHFEASSDQKFRDDFGSFLTRLLVALRPEGKSALPDPMLILSGRNPKHPDYLCEEAPFFMIPLLPFSSDTELSGLFRTIAGCCNQGSFQALNQLLHKKFAAEADSSWGNRILEVKPNVAGVGINLNALFELLEKSVRNRKAK